MGNVNPKPVILVTGTLREAALVKEPGIVAIAGGSSPARLVSELREAAPGAAGIISFGMGGAIDRYLKLGDIVIGSRLTGDFPCDSDRGWVMALKALLPEAQVGAIHADGDFFGDMRQKVHRAETSAALAVDMESHIAGAIAAEMGIPFVALRCISDVMEVNLPPAIAVAMKPDGGVNYGAVIGSILSQPGQLGQLARTVRGFAKAYGRFGKALRRVDGRLGFDRR